MCFECNKKGHTTDTCWITHPEHAPWNKREDIPIGKVRKGSRRERKYEDKSLTNKGKKTVRETGRTKAFIADSDPFALNTNGTPNTGTTQPCGGTVVGSNPPKGNPAVAPCTEVTFQVSLTVK